MADDVEGGSGGKEEQVSHELRQEDTGRTKKKKERTTSAQENATKARKKKEAEQTQAEATSAAAAAAVGRELQQEANQEGMQGRRGTIKTMLQQRPNACALLATDAARPRPTRVRLYGGCRMSATGCSSGKGRYLGFAESSSVRVLEREGAAASPTQEKHRSKEI